MAFIFAFFALLAGCICIYLDKTGWGLAVIIIAGIVPLVSKFLSRSHSAVDRSAEQSNSPSRSHSAVAKGDE